MLDFQFLSITFGRSIKFLSEEPLHCYEREQVVQYNERDVHK